MQGEFFRRLKELDAAAATLLHGIQSELRAYTISPINGEFRISNGTMATIPGQRYWFRLTGIGPLASAALDSLCEHVRVWKPAGARFRVEHWEDVPSSDESWAGELHEDQLFSMAEQSMAADSSRIVFEFASPTTLSSPASRSGRPDRAPQDDWNRCSPLPLPPQVFKSVANQLAHLGAAVERPPLWESILEQSLRIQRYDLSTQLRSFGPKGPRFTGFTGIVEFGLHPELATAERLWLHMLAGLAFYTGVGKATSWGMGQVRRIPADLFSYRG
jgi:CRISPR-associated endoribonuclease Cas6